MQHVVFDQNFSMPIDIEPFQAATKLPIVKVETVKSTLYRLKDLHIYSSSPEGVGKMHELFESLSERGDFGRLVHEKMKKLLNVAEEEFAIIGVAGKTVPNHPDMLAGYSNSRGSMLGLTSNRKLIIPQGYLWGEQRILFGHESIHFLVDSATSHPNLDPFADMPKSSKKAFWKVFEEEKKRLKVNPHPENSAKWNVHNWMYDSVFKGYKNYPSYKAFPEVIAWSLQHELAFDGGFLRKFSPAMADTFLEVLQYHELPLKNLSTPLSHTPLLESVNQHPHLLGTPTKPPHPHQPTTGPKRLFPDTIHAFSLDDFDMHAKNSPLKTILNSVGKSSKNAFLKSMQLSARGLNFVARPQVMGSLHVICAYEKAQEHAILKAVVNGTGTFTLSLAMDSAMFYTMGGIPTLIFGVGSLAAELLPDLHEIERRLPNEEELRSIGQESPDLEVLLRSESVEEYRNFLKVAGHIQHGLQEMHPARLWEKHAKEPIKRSIDEYYTKKDFETLSAFFKANPEMDVNPYSEYEKILTMKFDEYLEKYPLNDQEAQRRDSRSLEEKKPLEWGMEALEQLTRPSVPEGLQIVREDDSDLKWVADVNVADSSNESLNRGPSVDNGHPDISFDPASFKAGTAEADAKIAELNQMADDGIAATKAQMQPEKPSEAQAVEQKDGNGPVESSDQMEPEEILEKQEEAVQKIIGEQIDWGKMSYEVGKSLVNDAVAYLKDKAGTTKVSREVKAFIGKYESEKRRILKQIPHDEEGLRESLTEFMQHIHRPERVVDSYANLEKAGQELSKALNELKSAKAALLLARKHHMGDLEQLNALDARYKKSLSKALRSARKAQRKVGLFSTILNTAGAVLMAIPTPATQIAGGSLMAVTSASRHLTSSNAEEIRDGRVQKFEGRLRDNNEKRQDIVYALKHIAQQVSEIDAAQLAYEQWISSQDSVSQLNVKDRFENLLAILNDKREKLKNLNEAKQNKESELEVLKVNADKALKDRDKAKTKRDEVSAKLAEYKDKLEKAKKKHDNYNQAKYADKVDSSKKELKKKEKDLKSKETTLQQLQNQEETKQTEINALTKTDLPNAEEVVKKKEERLKQEETLKPLYDYRVKILQSFVKDRKPDDVPTPAEFASDTLLTYYQLQVNELATTMNLLSAGGELSRALYHLGYPLPHYMHAFAQNFVQCGVSLDRLYKAYGARKADPSSFNLDNWINHLIAPGLRMMTSMAGAYESAVMIGFLWKRLGSNEKQRTLFDNIQEELSRQIVLLSQWMDRQFDDIRQDGREQTAEILNQIDLARKEQQRVMRGLSAQLERNQQKIIAEISDDRYVEFVDRVQKRAEKNESLISFGDLDRALENSRHELWNGYQFERSLSLRAAPVVWTPRIDLKHLPRNPFHLTGLIGQYLGVSTPLPNGRLLGALKEALVRSVGKAEYKNQLASKILGMQQEVLGLTKHIPSLMAALYGEQQHLRERFEKNTQQTRALRSQVRSDWTENVKMQVYNDKPLGRQRVFLADIVKTPLSQMVQRWDVTEVATSTSLIPPINYSVVTTALACMSVDMAGYLLMRSDNLGKYVFKKFKNSDPLDGRFFERLTETPNNQRKEPDRTARIGIDLKERKFVQITGNDASPTTVPFIIVKGVLDALCHTHFRSIMSEHALMKDGEMRKISAMPIEESLYKPATLFQDYSVFLLKKSSGLRDQLGQFELLPSKRNGQLPLAFPKAFMEHCESQIASEIRFAEISAAGCFIPHYEFSPQTNLLSVVFSFSSFKDGSTKSYCKFHAAHLDGATIASFKKDLMADGSSESFNELLLQALYGGYYSLGLPGDQSVILEKGVVAPSDRPFPGLYPILAKRPDATLVFKATDYNAENVAELYQWTLSGGKQLPEMIKGNAQPEFYPEFLEVRELLNARIKQEIRSSSYDEKYYLLMALVKLFSSAKNEHIYEILQGCLSINPPEQRDQVSLSMKIEDGIEEQIDEFMELLEEFPSEEKLSLRI